MKPLCGFSDFEKIDFRVGTIVAARPLEDAKKPAFVLEIDFGAELGIKQSSAQLTKLYVVEDLIGRQVIAVVNFPAKQIVKVMSECLVLGLYQTNTDVVLIQPDRKVENGLRLG